MENILVFAYFVCFAAIAGGAFALMRQTTGMVQQSSSPRQRTRRPVHPEAPLPGEEVLYVDLSRERLEYLYQQESDYCSAD